MKAYEVINELKKHGVSKYRIAKELGISWQTVHMWHRQVFQPSPDKLEKLLALFRVMVG